jgi:NAD-dependent SIR2 family protein deacetylase
VVLFGEALNRVAEQRFYQELSVGFDAVVVIGTSCVFPYIRLPVDLARSMGWPTVEINPSTTCISDLVDVRLPTTAAEALDTVWRRYVEHAPE